MKKIFEIRSLDDLKEYIYLNKESLKRAALPVTVAVALLLFWTVGISGGHEIEETGQTGGEGEMESAYEGEESYGDETEGKTGKAGDGDELKEAHIYVDISGCVVNPGVYQVAEGTRVFQLIEKAGGLTPEAHVEDINRAEEVYDGQKIVIYAVDEDEYASSGGKENYQGKININRADETQLQEIPGVGPATAEKIIEYRETIGRFQTVEDIKNVSGIGEKTFESMKEYITV